MFGDRAETGAKPSPKTKAWKPKPYTPPAYKVGMGDVKTNADRTRAENYKSGKSAPSKGNPTYAQSIRSAYDVSSPEHKRERLVTARTGMGKWEPGRTREDRIVMGEHARRVRQLQDAKSFHNANHDIYADMPEAKHYTGTPKNVRPLETGQSSFGTREQLDANVIAHAGDFIKQVQQQVDLVNPPKDPPKPARAPGDYGTESGWTKKFESDMREGVGMSRIDQKKKKGSGSLPLAFIHGASDLVTNPDNALSKAGHWAVDESVGAVAPVAKWMQQQRIAGNLGPLGAALGLIGADGGEVAGNGGKDLMDLYAQALPSVYQLGDAALSAAGGDTTKLNAQVQGFKDIAQHPGQALHDHPLLVPLMAKGGLSALGRTTGAAMRGTGYLGNSKLFRGAAGGTVRGNARDTMRKVADVASTQGRDPIKLPGKGTELPRRYSHDVISKWGAQKPYDAIVRRSPGMQEAQARKAERNVQDELTGANESTRRYHRRQVQNFLADIAPKNENARALLPFVAERSVRRPDTVKPDLERRLRHLEQQEKKIPAEGADRLGANHAMQDQIRGLLADDKLMAGGKHARKAFEGARKYAQRQNELDKHLETYGHLNPYQSVKGKLFTYAIEHMGASYDKNKRPTAKKVLKEGMDRAERQAEIAHRSALNKLKTTERRLRAERDRHKTLQQRGKVPGGEDRPLILRELDRQLKDVQTQLRRATNRTEAQAGRTGDSIGSARVRAERYDQELLNRDDQYRALRTEHHKASRELRDAKMAFANAFSEPLGKKGLARDNARIYSNVERHAALERLDEAQMAKDAAHADLHAYLDDVDRAAADGTTKMAAGEVGKRPWMMGRDDAGDTFKILAGHVKEPSAAEAHYATKGRGPVSGLAKAEREAGKLVLSRAERAKLYAQERHMRRQVKLAENEASKLKGNDIGRLWERENEHALAKDVHEKARSEYDALRESNKNFGKVKKAERTFVPGLVDKDGNPLTWQKIDAHLKSEGIDGGVHDVAYFTHRPDVGGAKSYFVSSSKAPYEAKFTRSGKAAKQGLYDSSFEALADSMVRSQGILDALGARRRFIDTFVKPDDNGNWYRSAQQAAEAARNIVRNGGPEMVPYMVSDARLDAARRKAQQAHFAPHKDEAIRADDEAFMKLGNNVIDGEGALNVRNAPPGNYGLITRTVADRARQHESVFDRTAAGKALGEFTARWRHAILYGTSVTKWLFGNLAELAVRLSVAGAGPRALYVGWKVMEATYREAGKPQEADFVKNMLVGGGHFSGSVSNIVNFQMRRDQSSLEQAMRRVTKPTINGKPRDVAYLWNQWKRMIEGVNRVAEHGGAYAAIGKLALKDREGWHHLNEGWSDALTIGPEAAADVARGLLNSQEQVRYARHVYATIGRYTNLSPSIRKWVGTYTTFGLWYGNALKFTLLTIPRNHPLFGALLSTAYLATQKDREQLGQTLWGDTALPGFLQGSLNFKGYGPAGQATNHQLSRYTPFGVWSSPSATLADQFLPQLGSTIDALRGQTFSGAKVTRSDGHDLNEGDRLMLAAYVTFEGMVPFLPNYRAMQEEKGTPYSDSHFWDTKVKPGTKRGKAEAARSIWAPGYGYKNGNKPGSSSSGPTIPSIPNISMPSIPTIP